jgi:hypothetical protein
MPARSCSLAESQKCYLTSYLVILNLLLLILNVSAMSALFARFPAGIVAEPRRDYIPV